jgi:hypothetical protein
VNTVMNRVICCLTTLSVLGLYSDRKHRLNVLAKTSSNLPETKTNSVDERMVNECRAVGGMRIGRGNGSA